MNNSELIDAVASRTGLTKADAKRAVDAVAGVIQDTVVGGGEVSFANLGKFKVKQTSEREGRNPATGESITIAAGRKVSFSASKTLKDSVNR